MNETPDDLAEEQKMAADISKKWHCDLKKLPKNYHIDYAIMKGDEAVGFVEMRRRHIKAEQYPDTFISLKKWMGMQSVARVNEMPVYWAVQYDDKLLYTKADDTKHRIGINGNRMRGYEEGFEPVVHIPTESFKEVSEKTWKTRVLEDRETKARTK